MTAGGRGLALAILLATGVALVAVPVGASEETIAACSNGIAVPDPEENPGLVNDCEVLLEIRDTLAGDATLDWSADKPIRAWEGTRILNGRVDSIHLFGLVRSGPDLTGQLPPALARLSGLTLLDLAHNQLTGEIPAEIGRLGNLRELDLSNNRFEGEIPPEISQLSKLEILELNSNQLQGSIPRELGEMIHLRELWLFINNLTGVIPKEIGNMIRLEKLLLDYNDLEGNIPQTLGNLSRMKQMNLGNNVLSGEIHQN